ncbi:MAG: septal ring lytic transglycosylase RlpA family protein [Gammaproteobacteria bacterium]|nr:septal ring lytic transglycosylase RlpA family protein [Gammaproteobacteria bacterium]
MMQTDSRSTTATRIRKLTVYSMTGLIIQGCSMFGGKTDGPPHKEIDWMNVPNPTPRTEPRSKRGNPESYVVFGERYFVKQNANDFTQHGIASWYGTKFHGRLTSSGEVYDMYKMTAAHKTLPLPVYVTVTNVDTGKEIIVRVNDRGPFVDGRIIDLSYVAAKKLGITQNGTANVTIKAISTTTVHNQPQHIATIQQPNTSGNQAQYFLQVGVFSQRKRAEQFATTLMTLPVKPVIITNSIQNQNTLYHVRIGPFHTEDQIEPVESHLMEQGYTESYIVKETPQ